jgi:hypothetical protein
MPHHANQTGFQPGFDPRRHVFSKAERQKGYRVATQERKMPSRLRARRRNKILRHYQRKQEGAA